MFVFLSCSILYSRVHLYGQTEVRGKLVDTLLFKDRSNASIAFLDKDSTIAQFTRAKKDGAFVLKNVHPGEYRVFISHPSYMVYSAFINVRYGYPLDMGAVYLSPKPDTLPPFVVGPRYILPKIHGDTLEYNTANIKTRINANVEELLRRLPGVQVDENGSITVNGRRIERLLVDGADFFSSDPTMATKNLNADMISKVQVLDKKSDQAQFTGIDDGKTTRTINLTLKEDSKRAYFLKTGMAGDMEGYYNLDGVFGSFDGKRQLALLAMTANIGASGFYGSVGGFSGGIGMTSGSDPLGASAGIGVPRTMGAGIHYADKWPASDGRLLAEYSFIRSSTNPLSSNYLRQTLRDSIYIQRQLAWSSNMQVQHTLNGNFGFNPDSVSSLRLTWGGNNMESNNTYYSLDSSSMNDRLLNDSRRTIRSDVMNREIHGTIMYQLRAHKVRGRNLSVSTGISQQDNSTNGHLFNINHFFFPNGSMGMVDTVDQRKVFNNGLLQLNGELSYTEPLWRSLVLGIVYGVVFNQSHSYQETFALGSGKYDLLVDSLSNRYAYNSLSHHVTINLQGDLKRLKYVIGGQVQDYRYKQTDEIKSTVQRQQYINLAPRANLYYSLNHSSSLNFVYTGNTIQPSITQLQPVQNNNDPLHVVIGNPYLRPGFFHNVELNFESIRATMINASLHWDITTNGVSTRVVTDSLGKQITQAVNVNGTQNTKLYIGLSRNIRSLGLDAGLTTIFNYGRAINYVNDVLSNNINYRPMMELWMKKFVDKKYSFSITSAYGYSFSRSSINPGAPIHYWTQRQYAQLAISPTVSMAVSTGIRYDWRQKLDASDRKNATMIWDAGIEESFLKNRLNLSWRINDILGQNSGINRTTSANQLRETVQNILGRFWMLSASWRFVHKR
jgi:hypothetical protein